MRLNLLLLIAVGTSACTMRPGPEALAVLPETRGAEQVETIYVATTRARSGYAYSAERSPALSFEQFTIAVPTTERGATFVHGRPRFPVRDRQTLSEKTFNVLSVDPREPGLAPRKFDVLIFVHGFNHNFQEAVFRLAQIATDGNLEEVPILFAWPSSASATSYIADRDAAAYSRDDLAHVVKGVAMNPNVAGITLFGHSMGAWLAMESLRQLRLSGQNDVLNRLQDVVLAAPDIDIDLFRRQMEVIGQLDAPITILVSEDDRALAISRRLGGWRERVGRLTHDDPAITALVNRFGIKVVDISEFSAPDVARHSRYISLVSVFGPRRTGGTAFSVMNLTDWRTGPGSD